jgi:hypothetical protein
MRSCGEVRSLGGSLEASHKGLSAEANVLTADRSCGCDTMYPPMDVPSVFRVEDGFSGQTERVYADTLNYPECSISYGGCLPHCLPSRSRLTEPMGRTEQGLRGRKRLQ